MLDAAVLGLPISWPSSATFGWRYNRVSTADVFGGIRCVVRSSRRANGRSRVSWTGCHSIGSIVFRYRTK